MSADFARLKPIMPSAIKMIEEKHPFDESMGTLKVMTSMQSSLSSGILLSASARRLKNSGFIPRDGKLFFVLIWSALREQTPFELLVLLLQSALNSLLVFLFSILMRACSSDKVVLPIRS